MQHGKAGGKPGLRSFRGSRDSRQLRKQLSRIRSALIRSTQARNRRRAALARHDQRSWQVTRRDRTRQLIELGGLIVKAGLVDLTSDDRAVLLGLLVEAAAKLSDADADTREQQIAIWQRRGKRAFEQGSNNQPS